MNGRFITFGLLFLIILFIFVGYAPFFSTRAHTAHQGIAFARMLPLSGASTCSRSNARAIDRYGTDTGENYGWAIQENGSTKSRWGLTAVTSETDGSSTKFEYSEYKDKDGLPDYVTDAYQACYDSGNGVIAMTFFGLLAAFAGGFFVYKRYTGDEGKKMYSLISFGALVFFSFLVLVIWPGSCYEKVKELYSEANLDEPSLSAGFGLAFMVFLFSIAAVAVEFFMGGEGGADASGAAA